MAAILSVTREGCGPYRRKYSIPSETPYKKTFYIAAVEIEWDFAPTLYNFIRDEPLWSRNRWVLHVKGNIFILVFKYCSFIQSNLLG